MLKLRCEAGIKLQTISKLFETEAKSQMCFLHQQCIRKRGQKGKDETYMTYNGS